MTGGWMNKKTLSIIIGVVGALLILSAIVLLYLVMFGYEPSESQTIAGFLLVFFGCLCIPASAALNID